MALGLSAVATVVSVGSIAITSSNNSDRLNDIREINAQQAKLIQANALEAKKARVTSRAACVRTRQVAPQIVAFYESFNGTSHALDPALLEQYRSTIPKVCQ